jgi:DNA-binding NtrC family response regulator
MKILIVDDYPELPKAMSYALKNAGHEVEMAFGGREGLLAFRTADPPFDAVVSDYNMPIMDGYKMIVHILKLDPKVKVVMMSGDDWNKPPMRTPPIKLLGKPFEMRELLQELEKPST